MKKLIILQIAGIMLLTGAGCSEAVQEQLVADQTENTSTTEERQSAGQRTNTPAQNTNGQNAATPSRETTLPIEVDEESAVVIEESNQEHISFFDSYPTHPRNYEAYQFFSPNSERMARAIVRASPAGVKAYDKSAWIPYDPAGSTMVKVGEDAATLMLAAHKAFKEERTNAGTLSEKAYVAVEKYLQAILVFEDKWSVSGLN